MVYFVGAGPGAADLITVRGQQYLKKADVIVYAGSLVNPALLEEAKESCRIYNSAEMTLMEVIQVMEEADREGKLCVRLHTGDPSLYGAIREQMDCLRERQISFEICPGVSSFCGAAASLQIEYTLPAVSQTVILTRLEGRTPVPQKEAIEELAAHQATMVVFLSTGMLGELQKRLQKGGYSPQTPAAIIYKATWPEEKKLYCTAGTLEQTAKAAGIRKTALIIVGNIFQKDYSRTCLYDEFFTTEYREGKQEK